MKYRPLVSYYDDHVTVEASNRERPSCFVPMGNTKEYKWVYAPNWIESFFGVTWFDKIKKAHSKIKKVCDKKKQSSLRHRKGENLMKNRNLSGGLFAGKKPKPLTVTETALSASIAQYLDARHIYNDRLNSGKIFTGTHVVHLCKTGTPDRIAVVSSVAVYIEVKKLGEKPSIEQLERHQEIRRSGGIVIVTDSFDDFVRQFGDVERNIKKVMQPGVV